MSRAARVLVAVAVAAALAGCSASAPGWTEVALPEGFAPSLVLDAGGDLVVGGSVGDAPGVLRLGADGVLSEVPVDASSHYGALALWTSIVADGRALVALGGRTGGGHGNPRWTTWAGGLDGLVEQPEQGREVFGGWRGGGLAGMAVVDGAPFIVGSRTGEHPGLDVAVWHREGDDWIEQPSTGTPLAATHDALPFPTHVTARGSDLVISGFRQVLGGGVVATRAAVWIGPPAGAVELLELPAAGDAAAHAAACDAERCIVVGEVEGRLAAWLVADGSARALPVPGLALDADVPAPVVRDDEVVIVVPTDGAASILRPDGALAQWEVQPGPEGIPTSVAVRAGELFVVTVDGDGARLASRALATLHP